MKAITTKYHGPTNHRGARVTARDGDGNRVTVPYEGPYEGRDTTREAAHARAALALCAKMGWCGTLHYGEIKQGPVFVFTSTRPHGQAVVLDHDHRLGLYVFGDKRG